VAFSGENVRDEDLKTILGTIGQDVFFLFSSAVLDEKPQEVFPLVENLIASGYDLRFFFSKLIEHFRALLLVSSVEHPEDLLLVTPEELGALRSQSGKATQEDLLRYLVALQQGEQGLKYSTQPRIYLETFLIRLCQFRKIVPLKELIRDIEDLKRGGAGEARPGQVPSKPGQREQPASPLSPRPAARQGGGAERDSSPPPGPSSGPKPTVSPDREAFGRVLERLVKDRPPLAALVAQYSSVRIGNGLIEVFFERGKGFYGSTIQEKDVKGVERAAREVLGREMTVRFAEEGGGAAKEPPRPTLGREMEAALKDPAVQFFMNTFKAQVLSADPVKSSKDTESKGFGPEENGS
jgi:DNA polymerase-3 subunit gamma/tau